MTLPQQTQNQVNNFPISLYIVTKHGKPAIELRTLTSDPIAIKIIIERALTKQPILVFPTFRNELKATATLLHKKILEYDQEKEIYRFII